MERYEILVVLVFLFHGTFTQMTHDFGVRKPGQKVLTLAILIDEQVQKDHSYLLMYAVSSYVKSINNISSPFQSQYFFSIKQYPLKPSPDWKEVCNWLSDQRPSTILYLPGIDRKMHRIWKPFIVVLNYMSFPMISYTRDEVWSEELSKTPLSFLQLGPSPHVHCRAVLDLIVRYGWPSFSIINAVPFGHTYAAACRELIDDQSGPYWGKVLLASQVNFTFTSTVDQNAIYNKLVGFKASDVSRVIFLLADRVGAEEIFRAAKRLDLTGENFIWIVTRSALSEFEMSGTASQPYPSGLFGFSTSSPDWSSLSKTAVHMWIDTTLRLYESNEKFGLRPPPVKCADDTQKQLSTGKNWNNGYFLFNALKAGNYSVELDQRRSLSFNAKTSYVNYSSLILLNLAENRQLNRIGKWSSERGLEIDGITWPGGRARPPQGVSLGLINDLYDERNLQDPSLITKLKQKLRPNDFRILKVTTILLQPWMMKYKDDYVGNSRYYGYFWDVLEKLKLAVSFEYRIQEVADNEFGRKLSDGNWTGMIGELLRSKGDMIAIAPLTKTPEREESGVYFTSTIESGGITLLLERPPAYTWEGIGFGLLRPFSKGVWVLLAFSSLIVSLIIFALAWYHPNEYHNMIMKGILPNNDHADFSFRNSWMLIWTTLFLHGYKHRFVPRTTSVRVAMVTWFAFAALTVCAYISGLTIMLMTPNRARPIGPILTVDDLLGQNEIRYGAVKGGSTASFFKHSRQPQHIKLYRGMQGNLVDKMEDGVSQVEEGNYAFFMESPMAEFSSIQRPCKTMMLGEELNRIEYAIATSDESLRNLFDYHINKLRSMGYFADLYHKWFRSSDACLARDLEQKTTKKVSRIIRHDPLTVEQFALAPLFLVVGMLVALVFASIEISILQCGKDKEDFERLEQQRRELEKGLGLMPTEPHEPASTTAKKPCREPEAQVTTAASTSETAAPPSPSAHSWPSPKRVISYEKQNSQCSETGTSDNPARPQAQSEQVDPESHQKPEPEPTNPVEELPDFSSGDRAVVPSASQDTLGTPSDSRRPSGAGPVNGSDSRRVSKQTSIEAIPEEILQNRPDFSKEIGADNQTDDKQTSDLDTTPKSEDLFTSVSSDANVGDEQRPSLDSQDIKYV